MATAPTQTSPGSRRARRLAAEASAPTSRRTRKRARPLWQKLAAAAAMLALLAGSFALGWHFGVDSTRYKGGILLVNEDNLLSSDYVPEGLVNLYHGYSEADANSLLDENHLDPYSGFPAYRSTRCAVKKEG